MNYYFGNDTDKSFAVYRDGDVCYPVFLERYGTDAIPFDANMKPVTDEKEIAALNKYMTPYEDGKKKIYMAGPLFNEGDRYSNQINSDFLRGEGFTTFLPQEVVIDKDSTELVKTACFYMDFKAIDLCDYVVANCNGIEIDSGTAAEIGLCYGLNKKIIAYKSDVRNYYNDTYRLNNFVGGLVGNVVCSTKEEILERIKELG